MSNLSSTLRGNTLNDMGIMVSIQVTQDDLITFSQASLKKFVYVNGFNRKPSGSFQLMDSGELRDYGLISGMYGTLTFVGTSDAADETKLSTLDIYIDVCESIGESSTNDIYEINWSAGNVRNRSKTDNIYPSKNSIVAIKDIFSDYGIGAQVRLVETDTTDVMNWLTVKDDMWGKLDTVVSRSYKNNDFMYWVYDDVNSRYVVSSLNTEKATSRNYVFYPSESGLNSTGVGKYSKDDITYYPYMRFSKANHLGRVYSDLFPNIAFIGFPNELESGEIDQGNIDSLSFMELLENLGDIKYSEILTQLSIDQVGATFGDYSIKYHNKNGHNIYSIAEIYRNYKMATYSKTISVTLVNQVGPPIGSTCASIVYRSGRSLDGKTIVDEKFTDKYIVASKRIEYSGTKISKNGNESNGPSAYITTLILISDNYGKGEEVEETKEVEETI